MFIEAHTAHLKRRLKMSQYEAQKSIAYALDRAAARSCHVGRAPATDKQCWFLAKLLLDAGKDAAWVDCSLSNTNAVLTKSKASSYISDMLEAA